MKEKSKRVMNVIFLLLAVNSISTAKEAKDENEFIMLGSEYKMSDKNESKRLKKTSGTNLKNEIKIPDMSEYTDNLEKDEGDKDGKPEELSDDLEEEVKDEEKNIVVVKENEVIKAEKKVLGSLVNYETAGNVRADDNIALWAIDNNTNVVNKYIIESYYTGNETKNFSAKISQNANFINEGTIAGNKGGVSLHSGAAMTNNGTVGNTGDYGVYLENTGTELNNSSAGKIENGGNYGVYLNEGTKAENKGSIGNNGKFGIYVNNGKAVNNGVVENKDNFGRQYRWDICFRK